MELTNIAFKNFRVFKDNTNFEFAPITILTGSNSSGKTTIIKSLKLFQNFWSQKGFGHILNFEKGNHHLGDFEMSVSKNSEENEIVFSFFVDNILLGKIEVEMIFMLNQKDKLKNGVIKKARIKKGENIISTMFFTDGGNNFGNSYNYEYIFNKFFPDLQKKILTLDKEYEIYRNYIDNQPKSFLVFEDEIIKNSNLDYERFKTLRSLYVFDLSDKFLKPGGAKTLEIIRKYKKHNLIYNIKALDYFTNIKSFQSFSFYSELWNNISLQNSSFQDKYTFQTFKNKLEELEENGKLFLSHWIEAYNLSGEKNFANYLNNQIKLTFDLFTKKNVLDFLGIEDNLENRFYNTYIRNSNTIWQEFAQFCLDSINKNKNITDSEKAMIICHQIVSDAITIENEIIGNQFESNVDMTMSVLRRIEINIYKTIEFSFSRMNFINSIRAESLRLYSYENNSYEFNSFISEYLKSYFYQSDKEFINKWLKEFEIGDKLNIEVIGGVGTQVFIEKNNSNINIIDLGYGVTQLLPIIMKIIYCKVNNIKTIIIEEPEANLHPKFQSKLADLFADAYNNFGIKFILETHSEYLIRKFQILVAKSEFKNNDAILYYIGNPNSKIISKVDEQVKKIRFNTNGRLSQALGSGFYDEADVLSIELLNYSLN